MKAMLLEKFGPPTSFYAGQAEQPAIGPKQVLIKIAGTSVNAADVKARSGQIPQMFAGIKPPYILGYDFSGTITALGSEVSNWKIGDEVFGFPTNYQLGTFAEYTVANETEIARVPNTLSLADAGCVPLSAMTAWYGLADDGKIERNLRVLIHGAAGGVGHLCLQFARHHGAYIFATASSQNLDFIKELGADVAIDYKKEKFEDVASDIDLVVDCVGGDVVDKSWSTMKSTGALRSIVQVPDMKFARSPHQTGKAVATASKTAELEKVAEWIDQGHIRLEISHRFPLEKMSEAHAKYEARGVRGKIAIAVS